MCFFFFYFLLLEKLFLIFFQFGLNYVALRILPDVRLQMYVIVKLMQLVTHQ